MTATAKRASPTRFDRFLLWIAVWEEHQGVRVAVGSGRDTVCEVAHAKVRAALDLLAAYAPAQLARLRTHMRGVFVAPLWDALATWRPGLEACIVSVRYVIDPRSSAEDVAATLVHELTHARLRAHGFGYEERVRARVERVCFLAERNWAMRLPPSDARTALEQQIARYLALPTDRWSNVTLAAEREQRRRAAPLVLRVLGRIYQAAQRVRHFVFTPGRAS